MGDMTNQSLSQSYEPDLTLSIYLSPRKIGPAVRFDPDMVLSPEFWNRVFRDYAQRRNGDPVVEVRSVSPVKAPKLKRRSARTDDARPESP